MCKAIELTGTQYRAAFNCKANKDVCYYLDGAYLSMEHSEIVATDGKAMYISKVDEVPEDWKSVILNLPKIPANVERVTISKLNTDSITGVGKYLVETITKNGMQGPQFITDEIEGRYPDYKAVENSDNQTNGATNTVFGFDSDCLALIKTVFGKATKVRFNMPSPKFAATVTDINNPEHGKLILMPCIVQ